ncbi:MAG: M23 family metallopeptidase [Gemmatimonadales bacterium]
MMRTSRVSGMLPLVFATACVANAGTVSSPDALSVRLGRPVVVLPDSAGIPTAALAEAMSPSGEHWVGTYGRGIFVRRGDAPWRRIVADTSGTSISLDFVHAIAFDARGTVWIGTIGNGWGRSTDGGRTWKNWTITQLGPEWQYVAPDGIITHGDTVAIATADGLQVTVDNGEHWLAIIDGTGPAARGPAERAVIGLANEYLLELTRHDGWRARHLRGTDVLDLAACFSGGRCALSSATVAAPAMPPSNARSEVAAGVRRSAKDWRPWFGRPIAAGGNEFIDQTYRWGSTMGGFFQPHQGVEFNNPDGTPVHAIGDGTVVYAGPAERGALTVAIAHPRRLQVGASPMHVFSVYYHNSALQVAVGDVVHQGDVIAKVGHTGRATNDHLHLEVHAAPTDSIRLVVDSLNRYPAYTTNPELWITPLPRTGVIAGVVLDAAGRPVEQARVYGIVKPWPRETPFVFAETYGPRNRPHPVLGEHFAVSDVPVGMHNAWVMIGGKRVERHVEVRDGAMTWVEFRP